jgi:hypothetical protein
MNSEGSRCYSIVTDSTPDLKHSHQMTIVVRYWYNDNDTGIIVGFTKSF